MDANKIDMYLLANSRFFNPEMLPMVKDLLERADDSKFFAIQTNHLKDPNTLLMVSLFAGQLGIDRFMLGETGLGIAKLLTCGGFGIWTIIDWFTIMNRTREMNFEKLQFSLML